MRKLFRTVLVPHDFSPHATRALRLAARLARADRGRLVVLHVVPRLSMLIGVPPGGFPPADLTAQLAVDQERRLRALVAREVGRSGPKVVARVVVGDPFEKIVDAARDATVVVMGTLGASGLTRLVIGSVAEKVVRHAPVPVLTVRAGRGRRRRR